jgi:hypothetical protein
MTYTDCLDGNYTTGTRTRTPRLIRPRPVSLLPAQQLRTIMLCITALIGQEVLDESTVIALGTVYLDCAAELRKLKTIMVTPC